MVRTADFQSANGGSIPLVDSKFLTKVIKMDKELRELDDMLRAHDWYYSFSDDHGAWKRGEAASKAIAAEVKAIGTRDAKRLYQAYIDIHFSPARGFSYHYDD